MAWQFILTDSNFIPVGELLNCSDRKLSLGLNKTRSFSCKMRLDNPLSDTVFSGPTYIKAYRNNSLYFFGPLVGAEENGDNASATIAITAAGPEWILSHRLTGKSATGRVFSTSTDRAQIAKALIDETNALSDTHITTDSAASAASALTYTAGPYKFISDCITDLSSALDGFDWAVGPTENFNFTTGTVTSNKIGLWSAAPALGALKTEAIFEWGQGRKNAKSYKRIWTRDSQANKVYHNTDSGPDAPGYPTVSATDATAIAKWGLMEDLATASGLVDNTLRQQLVNEHVVIRSEPRQTFDFQPHVNPDRNVRIPRFPTDYDLGDTVVMRAEYNDVSRFDGLVRVWGVTFELDPAGTETLTLTLSQDGADS